MLNCQNCGEELELHSKLVHNVGHIACKECDHVLHPRFIAWLDNSDYKYKLEALRPISAMMSYKIDNKKVICKEMSLIFRGIGDD